MADSAAAARDAGLRRVSWLTRAALVGGLALTGVFSAITAHAFPGRSGRRATGVVPPKTDTVAPSAVETTEPPTTPPPTSLPDRSPVTASHRVLAPPATAPRRVVSAPAPVARRPVRPHVVSGGS